MQPDRHHLGLSCYALGIERIETVFEIGEKLVPGIKALRGGKTHIIGIEGIGHHQLIVIFHPVPIGQVIAIAVRDVIKAALFGDQCDGIFRTAPRIPAAGPGAGNLGMQADGGFHIGPFCSFGVIFIFNPFQSVAGNFPIGILHGARLFRAAGQRGCHTKHGDGNFKFGEQAVQAPKSGAGPVVINRFHIPVALLGPG